MDAAADAAAAAAAVAGVTVVLVLVMERRLWRVVFMDEVKGDNVGGRAELRFGLVDSVGGNEKLGGAVGA